MMPKFRPALLLLLAPLLSALAAEKPPARPAAGAGSDVSIHWIAFPDPRLEVRGLPWFTENSPELWRLPKSARGTVRPQVWARAVVPDGGRIRFSSPTAQLAIRVEVVPTQNKFASFDVYIGDELAGSARTKSAQPTDLVLFSGRGAAPKNITVYLPNVTEVRVLAVGVDRGAALGPAPPYASNAPLICYGSSVLQGTGVEQPSKTYPAVIARRLNLDFINLGFGGSGRAEPEVVALVNRPAASGFLFDLGKSYGDQGQEPYARMLAEIRRTHPTAPIFCVTPIYSTKEASEPGYREKSDKLRTLMRGAALERRSGGDRHIQIVEGLDLFGPADQSLFRDPLHPNDAGNERMAERLVERVRSAIPQRK
jgi:hypothetical protein